MSKGKKPQRLVYKKLDIEALRALGVYKKPTLDYSWRLNAYVSNIPSLITDAKGNPAFKNSIMNPMTLQKESTATQLAILEKAKRIAPPFNKAAAQYITDDTDPKTIGRK
jgi:hypothetical protein